LDHLINFYFNAEASAPGRDGSRFHPLPKFLGIFEWPPRLNWRVSEDSLLAALVGSGTVLAD
jgi:hypothetical protein